MSNVVRWTLVLTILPHILVLGQGHGPYLGHSPPSIQPEIFAPDIISTESRELNSVFNRDGNEFYFTRKVGNAYKVFITQQIEGYWSTPSMISFSKLLPSADEVDMMLSTNEEKLYYISNRPTEKFAEKSVNIWYSDKIDMEWSNPNLMPPPINSDSNEVYPTFVKDGSMYFSSNRPGGFGAKDIYRSQFKKGKFLEAINVGPNINTAHNEGDIYVDQQERFMIVSSWGREDSYGKSDLYISRKVNGKWNKLVNLGIPINSNETDFCPIISPDGKYFFFSRNGDIYWVSSQILEKFLE